jgi:hypothetical protein
MDAPNSAEPEPHFGISAPLTPPFQLRQGSQKRFRAPKGAGRLVDGS